MPEWAAHNGCASAPAEEQAAPGVRLVRYADCDQGATVELYVIEDADGAGPGTEGGGHTWPGAGEVPFPGAGLTTHEISATDLMWEFFLAHPMSAAQEPTPTPTPASTTSPSQPTATVLPALPTTGTGGSYGGFSTFWAVTQTDRFKAAIAHAADGDARRALGLLEAATIVHLRSNESGAALSLGAVEEAAGRRLLLHDRDREEHYNVVSALIKSLRASDPDAALYYAARMLEAGEDPLFVARRLVIFAAEDVGNADPQALGIATSAYLAVERIGMPEGRIPLGQAVTFLACAPKSNASYLGINRAIDAVRAHGSLPIPLHLRNAPTPLMKGMGYGRDYVYPHNAPEKLVTAQNLPDGLGQPTFYEPKGEGAESEIARRLADWRQQRSNGNPSDGKSET